MTHSYICRTCGIEYDTIPKAMACFDAHEAEATYKAAAGTWTEINPAGTVVLNTPETLSTVPEPKAAELLGRAARHMHDRAGTYDSPEGERSMGKAVAAFNAISGHTLSESEGWLFMTLLKAVRGFTREQYHADSFEDLIAYGALMAEAKSKGE